MALIKCPECGNQVSDKAPSCPTCGNPINTAMTCPKCGSTDVKVITGGSKALSIALWGPFAANTVVSKHQCKKCKHKF